jgi:hypothetical protein
MHRDRCGGFSLHSNKFDRRIPSEGRIATGVVDKGNAQGSGTYDQVFLNPNPVWRS